MGILVSINCITYNHEKYIADAIEGFLMQKTDFNYEILIGEDCSTDNTKKIVEEYVRKYPEKIKIITSEQNVGGRQNSVRLQKESQGKYIAICEGDDYWTDPYKLQKQINYMEENPGCTLCFHAAEIVEAPNKTTNRKVKPYRKDRISLAVDIITRGGWFCPTASLVYPRKLMDSPPEFYLTAHVGDYPLQIYLASVGYAYYIDDCMSVYRTGVSGSWTNNLNFIGNRKENLVKMYQGDIELLEGFNELIGFKYRKEVENTVLKREYAILVLNNKKMIRTHPRFKNHFKKLGVKDRLKIQILCSFPKSYTRLAEILSHFKNKKAFN